MKKAEPNEKLDRYQTKMENFEVNTADEKHEK